MPLLIDRATSTTFSSTPFLSLSLAKQAFLSTPTPPRPINEMVVLSRPTLMSPLHLMIKQLDMTRCSSINCITMAFLTLLEGDFSFFAHF